MPLSWTEIRDRAAAFQKRWKDDTSEQAKAQIFWAKFLSIYGVDRQRGGVYEKHVLLQARQIGQKWSHRTVPARQIDR